MPMLLNGAKDKQSDLLCGTTHKKTAGTASVRVKIDARDWVLGVMWSSSSRMRMLKEVTIRTGANCNGQANVPFRVQPVQKSLDRISTLEHLLISAWASC